MSILVRVRGAAKINGVTTPVKSGILKVELLDISRMGGESQLLGVQVQSGVSISESSIVDGKISLPFSLEGEIVDPNGINVVSAHLDVMGDGMVSLGDYLTTGMHPVVIGEAELIVDIDLYKVT